MADQYNWVVALTGLNPAGDSSEPPRASENRTLVLGVEIRTCDDLALRSDRIWSSTTEFRIGPRSAGLSRINPRVPEESVTWRLRVQPTDLPNEARRSKIRLTSSGPLPMGPRVYRAPKGREALPVSACESAFPGGCGQAGLHLASQMRYDTHHPLYEHQLAPVVHFMFFDRKDHFETAPGHPCSHLNPLT